MSQRMMLMIGAAVLVLALGVGGLLVWRSRATAPATLPAGQSASTQSTNGSTPDVGTPVLEGEAATPVSRGCAERESPEACSDAQLYAAAVAAKDAARCVDIGDALGRDLCIAAAAAAAGDASQCDRITTDGIRIRCTERAITSQARTQGDPSVCVGLSAAATSACEADVFAGYANAERCDQLSGEVAERCRTAIVTDAPPVNPQPPPALLDSGDEDGDGLTNGRENELGTNPFNSDTDGDGFADGDEVKNGYNPLGPGKLETTTP